MVQTKILLAAAAALAGTALLPAAASAGPVGQLSCNVSGGIGFVITSRRALNCDYAPSNGGPHQHYLGTISRYGLDLGPQGPGRLTWDVVSLGGAVGPGALSGSYAGASASATVGVGVGANALVGGANGGVQLQPLSVESQSGLNVAAGIGAMSLEYTP
ncbi:DUF992 domain-containing protein [Lichenibacterium dinghuense]|uniref:DUF992 domain-containing protein n=1 Tax=Lichenibacterium dinghuense TaxID=2895977 RepID=UPI001F179666|nr:DUF992 domain-containing protein [Lichenibacterium sp. 6Y81]